MNYKDFNIMVEPDMIPVKFNDKTIDEIMVAEDASGETLGYAFTVTDSEGYGGDIQFAMGVQNDGTLNGISILSISETAGLGMKATTDSFKDQFKNKNVEKFTYTKTGSTSDDQIDAISGATITTNAMTNRIHNDDTLRSPPITSIQNFHYFCTSTPNILHLAPCVLIPDTKLFS